MYAGMNVNWHEVTRTKTASSNAETLPLFLFAFSSDKGVEKITDFTASDFYAMYGKNADYFKYGQPLTQAHTVLNAGGRVLGYRLCAPDATLANIVITASVDPKFQNKTDANGNQIYLDEEGNETLEVTSTPAKVQIASIKYAAKTVTGATSFEKVVSEAKTSATATEFPILVITDNGRGSSIKKFRIAPDYTTSKSLQYCMYFLQDIENTSVVESTRFAIAPNAVYTYGNKTRSTNLIETSTVQLKTEMLSDQIEKFVTKLADVSGYSETELFKNDILFGNTIRGVGLTNIVVDDTGLVLNNTYGISLLSGNNGTFGDAPFPGEIATEAWSTEATKFFKGELTDEVWDYEIHRIDFCTDANYPDPVKEGIAELAAWRKDFYFFRDLGLDIWDFDSVVSKVSNTDRVKSPFVGDYLTTYAIIDPNSKKQIRVTMTHGLSPLLVSHYSSNVSAPLAGQYNNFVIDEAIAGTLNFSPRITPSVNQKELLDELRVNFASYANPGILVVQSLYTSQNHWGPLSYANNVIITQMTVKAVREYMPKIRFQQTESTDFSSLRQSVDDNVLTHYQGFFKKVRSVYTRDAEASTQKEFNFSLECYYKDWDQHENMDVYAIDGDPDEDTTSYTVNTIDIN